MEPTTIHFDEFVYNEAAIMELQSRGKEHFTPQAVIDEMHRLLDDAEQPTTVRTLLNDARRLADAQETIGLRLTEETSAFLVESLGGLIERMTRTLREEEARGSQEDADYLFEALQTFTACRDSVRAAREAKGWSPDGDEAPEEPGAGSTA